MVVEGERLVEGEFEHAQALSHAASIHPDVQTLNESLASDTIFCLEQLPGLPISLAC